MTDGIIDEQMVTLARRRVTGAGRPQLMRELSDREPELFYALNHFAMTALSATGDESVPSEVQDAAFDAVWSAALVALEAYRTAYYRLWRDTAVGTLLEQIDPDRTESA